MSATARPSEDDVPDQPASRFVDVAWNGRQDHIEYVYVGPEGRGLPLLVFLHEGLGSVTMWKDFPERLCQAAGCRGLVFSRWGYGESTPRALHERWPVDFMHHQALGFLPAFLAALGIDTAADPPWLYGHSDGGSIALIYAANYPERVAGLVVAAPHIFVEDMTVRSIEQARDGYVTTSLRSKLARYHRDPDSAFWGWNDVWLDPAFRRWNIEGLLPLVRCPTLAVQGLDDEYGTMAQIDGIARAAARCDTLKLEDCGHSPHRDQPARLCAAVADFIARHPHPLPDTLTQIRA
ncbi:alpha/beta hydrolase [Verticiella sediminum]|uniref:Alpha/beta hydrolase n=1 Tax=Verticiella sediminum TaxID=1247510 RepID=A0A556ANP0_9BURK|nr:alpha/beta hydrolase [Verticiella sediminum]TSH94504.1 alpha/beta hydrolase [Verticiella sediminum]